MESRLSWKDVHKLMDGVRAIARRLLRSEAQGRSLCTSALVLSGLRRQKLADQSWNEVTWQNREHFFAAMYRAMDRALKDHGRRRGAYKRKCLQWITLDEISPDELLRFAQYQVHDWESTFDERYSDLIAALAHALKQLENLHPDLILVARHRYYAGLTLEQTAQMMDTTERTVRRRWEKARILLHDQMLSYLHKRGYDIAVSANGAAPHDITSCGH